MLGLGQKTYRAGSGRKDEPRSIDVDDVERASAEEGHFVDDFGDSLATSHGEQPSDHRNERVQRLFFSRWASIHDGTSTRSIPVFPPLDTSTSTA